ncbi:MAG: hypothetical protein Q9217_005005 [Psora testacea]
MAVQHDGVNPNYLKTALQQARSEADSPDHTIGSGIQSGVATPRPDPTDKRLPGILHSYFGQVGPQSFASPSKKHRPTNPRLYLNMANPAPPAGIAIGCLHTAPSSPNEESTSTNGQSRAIYAQPTSLQGLPTPPTPSSCSSTRKGSGDGTEGNALDSDARSGGSRRPSLARVRSGNFIMPLRTRRCTASLHTPADVITTSAVHASHLSNPTTRRSSPSLSSQVPLQFSALSSLTSNLGLTKLTDGVASPPIKNTPPLTPRALSNDGSEPVKNASPSSSTQRDYKHTQGNTSDAATPRSAPPIGPPKGKLFVKILSARGLKPSYAPYAVCAFEWIESIAHEPKQDEDDMDVKAKGKDSEGGVPIKRGVNDMSRSMAIPMKSRQSSTTSLSDQKNFRNGRQVTDTRWDHEAVFDVSGKQSDVDISVFSANQDVFLGQVKMTPDVFHDKSKEGGWYKLEPRDPETDQVSGEIHLEFSFQKTAKKQYGPEDFPVLRLIGKGTFGQVYQVYKKDTHQVYAMKKLSKKVIVQKKEVAHTIGERNILVRTASADSPFIVGLKYSFQTPENLYLITGFMSGGELFYHLQKEGRFGELRAKFYIAELILALEHLHKFNIVYRDLKPENILLDATGHIALCDFGLSKANLAKNETTNTFCGTTEYLAPEVLLDEQGYTTMVDFWSLGVLVFEMCCGWSPFYAEDTQQMYKNIAFGKVRFPKDTLSIEGRNFVKGLLNRNPRHRLGAQRDADELKEHIFFADTDWDAVLKKTVVPPFKPKLKNILDVSNFDPEFTNALANTQSLNDSAVARAGGPMVASTPLSPGMQENFKGFTFVDESTMDGQFQGTQLDRMDEDAEEDEEWEKIPSSKRGDRMSGIIKTSSNDNDIFSDGHFDM